jgi:adenylosuccinate lyase
MSMEKDKGRYSNPLIERYASCEMGAVFSDANKFRTWRRLWIALAESQAELGLSIDREQLAELRAKRDDINFETMARLERELRHDVMAGIHAYGQQCPKAKGIIHLGATSCFVTDNTELIQYHQALAILRSRLLRVIGELAGFSEKHKGLRCLGYTHFQPAQPTTLGKRALLWLQELMINWEDLEHLLSGYRIRGAKGATGTQDSFLKLFGGDHGKVKDLDRKVCEKLGFDRLFPVSGQTYPRLWDSRILDVLKNLSQSAHKFAVDFRLMQHLKMVEEPFEEKQVGSSAMAYKRNPMRCERLCSLARYVIAQVQAADHTAANQWFERTLDDSAGRRLYLPQAFLAVDAILLIYANVIAGARVYPTMIKRLLEQELPFLATETVIMEGVARGGDRQQLHEAVRENAVAASRQIKEQGSANNLLELLARDQRIPFDRKELETIASTTDFSGRAEDQVQEYLQEYVHPLLDRHPDSTAAGEELQV